MAAKRKSQRRRAALAVEVIIQQCRGFVFAIASLERGMTRVENFRLMASISTE
jgi:hypothetical protein